MRCLRLLWRIAGMSLSASINCNKYNEGSDCIDLFAGTCTR